MMPSLRFLLFLRSEHWWAATLLLHWRFAPVTSSSKGGRAAILSASGLTRTCEPGGTASKPTDAAHRHASGNLERRCACKNGCCCDHVCFRRGSRPWCQTRNKLSHTLCIQLGQLALADGGGGCARSTSASISRSSGNGGTYCGGGGNETVNTRPVIVAKSQGKPTRHVRFSYHAKGQMCSQSCPGGTPLSQSHPFGKTGTGARFPLWRGAFPSIRI